MNNYLLIYVLNSAAGSQLESHYEYKIKTKANMRTKRNNMQGGI
jgi:uncharacterized membrane protein